MKLYAKIRYRIQQFFGGWQATVSQAEMDRARQLLPPAAFDHFAQLPVDAQRHLFNVLAAIEQGGHREADLAVAALLHDVGKLAASRLGLRINLWLRGPLVLAEALWPDLLRKLASDDPAARWRYLIHVHRYHPQIGAQWAREWGCSERACWLIEYHQEKQWDSGTVDSGTVDSTTLENKLEKPNAEWLRLLKILQAADDQN